MSNRYIQQKPRVYNMKWTGAYINSQMAPILNHYKKIINLWISQSNCSHYQTLYYNVNNSKSVKSLPTIHCFIIYKFTQLQTITLTSNKSLQYTLQYTHINRNYRVQNGSHTRLALQLFTQPPTGNSQRQQQIQLLNQLHNYASPNTHTHTHTHTQSVDKTGLNHSSTQL